MMRIKWINMLGVAVPHIAGAPQRVHCCCCKCLHPGCACFHSNWCFQMASQVAAWIYASLSSVGGVCLPNSCPHLVLANFFICCSAQ